MSRANGYTSYRGSSRDTRPSSAELVDLHVYIVPPDIWRERYNNFLNQHVTETISAGIIRVHPEHKVYGLRDELEQQVGAELLPRDYVFLKSVGRSITRLKPKQEYQLKAKHFIPPQAYAPELYLLEVGPGDRESSRTSTRPQTQSPISYTNNQESEDERQSASKVKQSESSPYRYSPLPKIRSARGPEKTESSSQRGEYNYNGDVKAENGRLSDSLSSSNRDRQSPTPQHMSRSPPHSHSSPPRQQTPREESQRAPREDSNRSIRVPREHSQQSQRTLPEGSQQFQKTQRSLREGSQQFTKDEPRQAHSSTSPTPSTDHRRRPEHREPVGDSYTNHTNEDSGINVNSPEDHFDALDRRKPNDDRNDDLQRRLQPDRDNDGSDRQRREDQDQDEWERKRREEEERRRYQDEEHRRREEQERRREEDDRRRLEEERSRVPKQQLTGSDEDLNRFPSPPPMQIHDTQQKDTESGKQNRKAEKERLLKELEAAREARRAVEKQREELVKKAKLMQTKTQNRRNHARDLWKKRYFEEKKKTPPLEEQCNRLRHELDIIHRKLMNTLEGPSKEKSTRLGDLQPSQKVGAPIQQAQPINTSVRNNGPPPLGYINYENHLNRQGYQRINPNYEEFPNERPYIANNDRTYLNNNYYSGQPKKLPNSKFPPISPPSKASSRPSSYSYTSPASSAYHSYSNRASPQRPQHFSPKSIYSPPRSKRPSPANSGKSVRFDSRSDARQINGAQQFKQARIQY